MFELLFLLSFTLHNIEEALWLPKWSRHAGKFHPAVKNNEFHFALLVITTLGYIIMFLFMIYGSTSEIIKYAYLGFVLMMCANAIFPHLIASIIIKKYAPGTVTGLFLNMPVGLYIVLVQYSENINVYKLFIGFVLTTIIVLLLLKPLFKIGKYIIEDY